MQFSTEEKAMWVEDWRGSGKSAWAYAQANGLNPRTFVKWAKAETATKPCFVEVPAAVIAPAAHAPEILIERGDVRIHIPIAVGNAGLRAAMESLGAEAAESGVLGQDRLLAKPEAAGERQVSVAGDGGSGAGAERGRAGDAVGRDRFFQGA